ncbi:MAG TPA: OB-fold domain-containing protein [Bacteroidales bacterium]|nr:OB-fold domain-containing protein [Bacteroidales bacterium]
MYDYIRGALTELNPTDVTLEAGGIGYHILISLTTYSNLQKAAERVLNSIFTSTYAKMKNFCSAFLTRMSALCSAI